MKTLHIWLIVGIQVFFVIDDDFSYLEQSVDETEKKYGGEFQSTKDEKFLNTKSNEYIVTENKDSGLILSQIIETYHVNLRDNLLSSVVCVLFLSYTLPSHCRHNPWVLLVYL